MNDMNLTEKENFVIEEMGYEELYIAISKWMGTADLEAALDDIIRVHDLDLPQPEDDYLLDAE